MERINANLLRTLCWCSTSPLSSYEMKFGRFSVVLLAGKQMEADGSEKHNSTTFAEGVRKCAVFWQVEAAPSQAGLLLLRTHRNASRDGHERLVWGLFTRPSIRNTVSADTHATLLPEWLFGVTMATASPLCSPASSDTVHGLIRWFLCQRSLHWNYTLSTSITRTCSDDTHLDLFFSLNLSYKKHFSLWARRTFESRPPSIGQMVGNTERTNYIII